ncbi:MAG TPA: hypothetical protein VGO92_05440 [Acidimicrobiales bacterium]|nr:hypothetical protein [Acidimicrobiales bacterium]
MAAAVAISQARFGPGACRAAVLAPADPLLLAVAAPMAAVIGGPVLIAAPNCIPTSTRAELERIGATRLVALGLDLPGTEKVGTSQDDSPTLSIVAAIFVRAAAGTVRAFAIGATEQSHRLAGPVGAAAALRKFPVMLGPDAARQGAMEGERRAAVTYLVGRDAIAAAAQVPGGFPLPAPTDDDVAARLAQLLKADGVKATSVGIAPPGADPVLAAVLGSCGGPVLTAPASPTALPGDPAAPSAQRVFTLPA